MENLYFKILILTLLPFVLLFFSNTTNMKTPSAESDANAHSGSFSTSSANNNEAIHSCQLTFTHKDDDLLVILADTFHPVPSRVIEIVTTLKSYLITQAVKELFFTGK
jgi:hypothetical protein